MHHLLSSFDHDDMDFIVVACTCGSVFGPMPDEETAIDALMEHAFLEGQASAQD